MEIGNNEIEWIVVERLRLMLQESTKAEYDVTQAYALFTAIVCWLAQRLRSQGSSDADLRAQKLWQRFQSESYPVLDRLADSSRTAVPRSVAEAIETIRNAVAHADARTVRAVHERTNRGHLVLKGYSVGPDGRPLLLTASMMVRFGTWLAEEFVKAMNGHGPDVVEQVNRSIREDRA